MDQNGLLSWLCHHNLSCKALDAVIAQAVAEVSLHVWTDFGEASHIWSLAHAVGVGNFMGRITNTTEVVFSSHSTFAAWEYIHNT